MKKILQSFVFLSVVLALGACSFTGNDTKKSLGFDNSGSKATLIQENGVFLDKFDDDHIDLMVGKSKKMYNLSSEMSKVVKSLKKDDEVSFAYEDADSGDLVIHVISKLNPEAKPIVAASKEIPKEKKATKKKTSEKKNHDFSINTPNDFTLNDHTIVHKKDQNVYAKIELLSDSIEIRRERWDAAPVLKKMGNVKELIGDHIPNDGFKSAEFVFTGHNKKEEEYISVKKIDGTYYRFTIHFSSDTSKSIQNTLWNSLDSVKKP